MWMFFIRCSFFRCFPQKPDQKEAPSFYYERIVINTASVKSGIMYEIVRYPIIV